MTPALPQEVSEPLVAQIVYAFYDRVRQDGLLGPIFEARIGNWDAHLATMVDFWSSLTLMSGRYGGKPHIAHLGLGLSPVHFEHWLALFEGVVAAHCAGPAAALFIGRARRVADSLQIGLNIGDKALHLPSRPSLPAGSA
ncbi:group III truncated hemoglobin [Bosea sp. (in: a-proteobacteria)]|uniref:group III truncated hemoglobin n=1 Tax=Bosea sp. (in: a-proteobacteria) TaxID=1871050 RepID=UPI002FCC86A5